MARCTCPVRSTCRFEVDARAPRLGSLMLTDTMPLGAGVLLLAACRRTEIMNLTWGEVNGVKSVIDKKRIKNGREHRAPITGCTISTTQEFSEGTDARPYCVTSFVRWAPCVRHTAKAAFNLASATLIKCFKCRCIGREAEHSEDTARRSSDRLHKGMQQARC